MSADRYSDLLKVRCRPELVETVDRAAAAQFVRPSEYIRRAVIDRLHADWNAFQSDGSGRLD